MRGEGQGRAVLKSHTGSGGLGVIRPPHTRLASSCEEVKSPSLLAYPQASALTSELGLVTWTSTESPALPSASLCKRLSGGGGHCATLTLLTAARLTNSPPFPPGGRHRLFFAAFVGKGARQNPPSPVRSLALLRREDRAERAGYFSWAHLAGGRARTWSQIL